MLRIIPLTAEYVEATPVPVVLNSESFLGSGLGNQKGHETSSWATSETNSRSEVALITETT